MSPEGDFISLTLTAETNDIPVNANRTSGSPWRKDAGGNELKGFPVVRDFNLAPMRDLSGWNGVGNPPEGPALSDPDLKSLTATFSPGFLGTEFKVDILYAGTGRIRLWTDQMKTTEIPNGGVLPTFPECTFYAEGIETSSGENDVTVRVSVAVNSPEGTSIYTATQQLTVAPFVTNMKVQPTANPPTVTLLRDSGGKVIGLNSGEQWPVNGGNIEGFRPGATFMSSTWYRGVFGNPEFIQNVLGVDDTPPAVTLTNGLYYQDFLHNGQYPILDYVANDDGVPFYPILRKDNFSDPNQVIIG